MRYLFVVLSFILLFSNCINKAKKEDSIEFKFDSIKSLDYLRKGIQYYERYSFDNNIKLLDSAIFSLKKSIQNNKKNIGSYENIIMIFANKEDFRSADTYTNMALNYTNQKAYYLAKKGAIKNKLNQKDSAQYYFNLSLERYYKKEKNLGIQNQIIRILYQMGNNKQALKVIDKCILDYPKDSLYLKELKKMINSTSR
jgi:tetratricopeptide (TPR) repeat protein